MNKQLPNAVNRIRKALGAIFTPLANWRIMALTILGIIAFILLCGETDSLSTFALIKVSGFGLAYFTYRIGSYWGRLGLIDELDIYDANE